MNKKTIKCAVLVLGVIVIPLLYSFFYLQAFWDPYNTLKTLPVAVVNEDKGAVINGAHRNLGSEAVKKLKKDGTLKFIVTNADDAESGTEGTKYYAVIKFPSDFSADIASSSTTNKHTAVIEYKANNKRNYIASQIMKNAVTKIEESTRGNVDKEIVAKLVSKINEVPKQLSTLKKGLNTLGGGAATLASATSKAADGQNTLKTGIESLDTGLGKLNNGASTLNSGISTFNGKLTLASDGTKKLSNAVSASMPKLTTGIKTLNKSTEALSTGAQKVNSGAQSLLMQFSSSKDANNPTLYDGVTGISNGMQTLLKQFSASTDAKNPTLYDGLTQVTNGTQTYVSAVDNTLYQMIKTNPASPQLLEGYKAQLVKAETAYATATDAAAKTQYLQQVQMLANLVTTYTVGTNPTITSESAFEAALVNAAKADPNAASVVSSGAALSAGTQQMASQFADGGTLKTSVTKLTAASQLVASQFADGGKFKSGVSQLADGTKQLADGAQKLSNGTAKFAGSAGSLGELNSSIGTLSTGLTALENGSSKISSGSKQLLNGIGTAQSGSKALLTGADKLASAGTQISDGAQKLSNGVNKAKSGVATSITKTNNQIKSTKGLSNYAEKPASIKEEKLNYLPNYGSAFAPYFMSLSLWVGALLMFFGIYLDADERIKVLSRHSDNKLARVGAFVLIGVAQAIALALIVHFALGFKVYNVPAYYLSCILISLVFISIIEFLIVNLKDVGKFLSIALLILNLTACGGTFPMETVPKFFNVIYPFMPMTYSVGLLKEVSSNFNAATAWHNAAILIVIFVVFTGLTILFSVTRKAKARVQEMVQTQN